MKKDNFLEDRTVIIFGSFSYHATDTKIKGTISKYLMIKNEVVKTTVLIYKTKIAFEPLSESISNVMVPAIKSSFLFKE